MIVCAAGDSHGALDRLYADVLDFEASLSVRFDWVLHVGDFGAWPDPSRIDGATKRHEGAGDFPVWWSERRAAPRSTVFIKGNHEDFVWLDAQADPQVLPGLFYLRNGARRDLTDGAGRIVVGGLGGCFGPSDYGRQSKHLQSYAKRHYTRDEIDAMIAEGPSTSCWSTTHRPACVSSAIAAERVTSARPRGSTISCAARDRGSASSATTTHGSTRR